VNKQLAPPGKVSDLEKQLQAPAWISSDEGKLSSVNATLEEREKGAAEYKARAHQLELIKARFER